jgi:hypothetical protein
MTDGGCAASSLPNLCGDWDPQDAFAAGCAAQTTRHADYLDAYAAQLGERYDADTAGTLKPIIAGLATTIRAGIADSDGDSHDR